MRNYDYFADAYDYANNFSNANGWDGFVDQYNYMDNGGVGAVHSNANPADSLPYVLQIANSTTDNVSNVVILGANQNTVGATNFGNVAAITITMNSGATTYQQFLENIKSQPFKVGLMHLQSSNANQPFQVLTFTQPNANGTSTTWPVSPILDPNQNQSGVTIVKNKFVVNAWTQISTTILASATLTMRLYPMTELNVARGIEARPVEKGYGAPDLYQLPFRG